MSQNNLKYLLKILSGIFFKKNANNFLLIHFYIQQKKTLTGNVSGFLFILVIKCHIIQYIRMCLMIILQKSEYLNLVIIAIEIRLWIRIY